MADRMACGHEVRRLTPRLLLLSQGLLKGADQVGRAHAVPRLVYREGDRAGAGRSGHRDAALTEPLPNLRHTHALEGYARQVGAVWDARNRELRMLGHRRIERLGRL